jgi:O-acetyl-ADP-ribose deacetylase (regulator of RNase III)
MNKTAECIKVVTGDITKLDPDLGVEAIVNAANESLLGGGGVDGAIHRAAGPGLLEHNRRLDGCPTGQAVRTPAFDLEQRGVRHILHTVGPVWRGDPAEPLGANREDDLLRSCYDHCLALCQLHDIRVVAFPGISTGVYGFPKPRAATLAVQQVRRHLAADGLPRRVVFCCFSEDDANVYRQVLAEPAE